MGHDKKMLLEIASRIDVSMDTATEVAIQLKGEGFTIDDCRLAISDGESAYYKLKKMVDTGVAMGDIIEARARLRIAEALQMVLVFDEVIEKAEKVVADRQPTPSASPEEQDGDQKFTG